MNQDHHTSNNSYLNFCKNLQPIKNAFVAESMLVYQMFAKKAP